MKRILVVSALVVGSVTAATHVMAGAPVGGCPAGRWELRATPPIDPGNKGQESFDLNGDGLSCFLEAPEGGGIYTIIDNDVVGRA